MVGQKKYKTMTVDHNKINEFIMEIGACNLKIYAKDKIAQTKSKNTLKNLEIFSLCLKAIHSQVRNIPTRLDTTWERLVETFFSKKLFLRVESSPEKIHETINCRRNQFLGT